MTIGLNRAPACLALACTASLLLLASVGKAHAIAPTLYRTIGYETPVSAGPDDLLLIAGYGFNRGDRVIYAATDSGDESSHPREVPIESTASSGVAEVVSYLNVPYSLTIHLPAVLRAKQAYLLWVLTQDQQWSRAVRINDARPLWFSPGSVYATGSVSAEVPRYLKVVGRNLQPDGDGALRIRLVGKTNVLLKSEPSATQAMNQFVALAALPPRLIPDVYHVQIKRGRSGWIEVPDQLLQVRPDPPPSKEFDVSDAAFGGCKPNDGADDLACVSRAIAAAYAAGGGTVIFGPGVWNMAERALPQPDGVIVPRGVNLRGAGKTETTIIQDADGTPALSKASFTLLGRNTIEALTFRDAHHYSPAYLNSSFIQLGPTRADSEVATADSDRESVDDVAIVGNVFDRPNVAIGSGGSLIRRLLITNNEFGAFRIAIDLSGHRYRVNSQFNIEDSVVTRNLFKPGSYIDAGIRQGTMASELGASLRVDFSQNIADGAALDRLYSNEDVSGWRAAFFWHMNGNNEMLLVAENAASCTGDRAGDGEAISYDNNANTFGLPSAGFVLRATADSVTVQEALARRQNDRDVSVEGYYRKHWIQVGEGPGLGQVRRIRSYVSDPHSGAVTFRIQPAWDVVPAPGKTRISVGREYWQVYTVANTIDHRQPLCRKSNRTDKKGGGISIWGQNADSVVAANRQYDTDGIVLQQYYSAYEPSCSECRSETLYANFLEIRDNLIDGEYSWDDGCSSSGIMVSLAAAPTIHSAPATMGYGLAISHNTVITADATGGGSISLLPTWYQGPAPHRWPLVSNALIHHNTLRGLDAAPSRPCSKVSAAEQPRTGISFAGSQLVWHSVLYANSCQNSRRALDLGKSDTALVCPAGAPVSCECPPP